MRVKWRVERVIVGVVEWVGLYIMEVKGSRGWREDEPVVEWLRDISLGSRILCQLLNKLL